MRNEYTNSGMLESKHGLRYTNSCKVFVICCVYHEVKEPHNKTNAKIAIINKGPGREQMKKSTQLSLIIGYLYEPATVENTTPGGEYRAYSVF